MPSSGAAFLLGAGSFDGGIRRPVGGARSFRERTGEAGKLSRGEAACGGARAAAALPTPQSGPTLTSVIGTVYTADGTPAQGVLIITWPAFVTASGASVAAGDLNVTLGANGALDVALAANASSKPGTEKKDAAMLFLQNALSTVDAVAAREIVDPEKFKEGISRIIDGTVICLNASSWCKQLPAANTQPSAR